VAASGGPAAYAGESATEVAVMDEPAEKPARRRRSKEEMLARALVSDIMVYNRDLYDRAKAEGNLLEALGGEIKKSWELYKEKVTPEVANSTNHFRDALNEILADGDKVF
jgi:molybdopterin converting factor small subunit